jgi:hypothetical protein
MKKNNYISIWITGLMLLLAVNLSCTKVQVAPPETQAELSKIFANDQTATSATVGLYVQMLAGNLLFCNGGITVYGGLSADEFTNVSSSSTYDPFKTNSLLAANNTINSTFWTNPYKNIYQANAVLEGLQGSNQITPTLKSRLEGEMLFIRAYHYFYLANLFDAVPYETSTSYLVNEIMPRTANDKMYDLMTSDLLQARQLLTDSYATSDNLRPNKGAATAMLARVYLYRKDWLNAEAMASEVIGSGRYSLESVANTFVSTSKETIYQVSKQTTNTAEGSVFIPASATAKPTFAITNSLLASFETGDSRKTTWLKSNIVSGTTYFYPYKYKVRTSTPVTEYYVFQRLAEPYLIRAEARANQNNLSDAIDDVDVIRSRAGLPKIKTTNPGISKDALLTAILKERQTEFFAEWANRWLDLKRTGKADEILGPMKAPNWQPMDKLYPIPYTQIQLNSFLSQNTGYTN